MSEKEKMLNGEIYNAYDKNLILLRNKTRHLTKLYNNTDPEETEKRISILKKLFGKIGGNFEIEPPFYCDYGNILYVLLIYAYYWTLNHNIYIYIFC